MSIVYVQEALSPLQNSLRGERQMNLRLEDHVFRVVENQARLLDGLAEFDWGLDLDTGLLTFTSTRGGRELARYPVQLIGSSSESSNTWLWAWANVESDLPPALLRGIEGVRAEAAVA